MEKSSLFGFILAPVSLVVGMFLKGVALIPIIIAVMLVIFVGIL